MGINVLIVDDHMLFRHGLERALGFNENVGAIYHAQSGEEALDQLEKLPIDLVFMDIMMNGMNGIEATKRAIKKYPELKIIAISQFDDKDNVKKMFSYGAKGYLVKTADITEINLAIELILKGNIYYSKAASDAVFKEPDKRDKKEYDRVSFSSRETEILKLLCREMTAKKIAEELFISEKSVEYHKSNMISKTQSKNSTGLISYAIKKGLHKI